MQAGGDTQDCLVGDGHLKGGDVDLLRATQQVLHLVGDHRRLIVWEEGVGRRVGVEDGVV